MGQLTTLYYQLLVTHSHTHTLSLSLTHTHSHRYLYYTKVALKYILSLQKNFDRDLGPVL